MTCQGKRCVCHGAARGLKLCETVRSVRFEANASRLREVEVPAALANERHHDRFRKRMQQRDDIQKHQHNEDHDCDGEIILLRSLVKSFANFVTVTSDGLVFHLATRRAQIVHSHCETQGHERGVVLRPYLQSGVIGVEAMCLTTS